MAMEVPAFGVPYSIREIGVASRHKPTKLGMVMRLEIRIAVAVRW